MKQSKLVWVVMLMIVIALPIVLSSCIDSNSTPPDYDKFLLEDLAAVDKTQLATDMDIIDDSLDMWQVPNVKIDPNGVRYTIENLGTGETPVLAGNILVKYKGRLLKNGREGIPFDESDNLNTYLYSLILGWQTTFPKFPKGTKATLYIPSGLGYGKIDRKNPNTGDIVIPKNSNLIFEIELVGVANPQ